MARPAADQTAFLNEWIGCYSLPYEPFVAARKAIAAAYGLSLNAAKTRANKHYRALRNRGLPVPVPPPAPAGVSLRLRKRGAGEGSIGPAVPVCAPPSPAAPREAKRMSDKPKPFRFNDGDIKPAVNAKRKPAGLVCIPVNLLEPGGCAFLKGAAEDGNLAYCNERVPEENKAKTLRRHYCAEHAAICVRKL